MITNRNPLLFFWAVFYAVLPLSAQPPNADSLRIEQYFGQLGQHCYANLDSTLFYLDVLLEETSQLGWTEEQAYAYLWGILCTGYHDQIDLKYKLLSEAEELMARKGGALSQDVSAGIDLDLRLHWGDYYMETGGYQGALDIYEPLAVSLQAKDSLNDEEFQRLVIVYQYLATIHRLRGSYREAIDFSFQALNYERRYYASRGEAAGDESLALSRIANAYWLKGERALAMAYYRPAFENTLRTYQADPAGKRRIRKRLISMGLELGQYYRELENADSAWLFLEGVTPYALPDEPIRQELQLEKALVLALTGNFTTARDSLQAAIARLTSHDRTLGSSFLLGRLHNGLGDILAAEESFTAALQAYQLALGYLHPDFHSEDLLQNPVPTTFTAPRELLYALTQKTRLLALHPPNEPGDWLAAAWSSARTGMGLVDSIRLSYQSDYDKQYLLGESYQLYELALEIAFRGGEPYTDEAFRIMENSKALSLFAAVRDLHARDFAGVPARSLEKARRLQYQLQQADARLESAVSEAEQIAGRQAWLALKQEYDSLIRSFEKDYPDYYRLKYQQPSFAITDPAAKALLGDQLLIEYFTGATHLYAFIYDGAKGQSRLFQLPWRKDFNQWAKTLKSDIYNREDEAFRRKASALYQALLEPLLADALPQRLLIIPDGVLGYLPFDILLTAPVAPGQENNFRQYPFLMRNTAVSQNFSLAMLREMKRELSVDNKELLAFAPSFPNAEILAERGDRAVLGELLFNQQEAKAVLKWFDGELIAAQQATKNQFLELSSRFRIYHIASHAVVDDETPNHSYIAFSTTEEGNLNHSRLYSYEILAQNFPADLVVLSACETGIGQVVKGEGIMSLARAFSYAGARSLITSLWNVNDQSGQELMESFYRLLKSGLTKDEALRRAKLSYLERAPDNARAHPKYWAAFIPTGNMDALGRRWDWGWGSLPLLLIVLIYVFYHKERAQKPD